MVLLGDFFFNLFFILTNSYYICKKYKTMYNDLYDFLDYNSENLNWINPAFSNTIPSVSAKYTEVLNPSQQLEQLSGINTIDPLKFDTPKSGVTNATTEHKLIIPKYESAKEVETTHYSNTDPKDINLRAKNAMNYFIQSGLSKEAAAGIVGNLRAESQFNPGIIGDTNLKDKYGNKRPSSEGIAQWRESRLDNLKTYAKSKNMDYRDFGTQLEFVYKEIKENPKLLAQLNNAKSAEEAAKIVSDKYERPKVYNPIRAQFAKNYYANN